MGQGRLRSLIVYPPGDAPTSVVLLLHNDLGLDSLQQALALQLAQHGFAAVAPDLLSGLGPNGGDYDSCAFPDATLRAVRAITPAEAMRRYKVAYECENAAPLQREDSGTSAARRKP